MHSDSPGGSTLSSNQISAFPASRNSNTLAAQENSELSSVSYRPVQRPALQFLAYGSFELLPPQVSVIDVVERHVKVLILQTRGCRESGRTS
jgi:hypothetical protein